MSRGDFKSGMPVPVSPNASSWKQQAEQLAEQNIELAGQLEDAQSRLEEIAQLAAPDQDERLEKLEDQGNLLAAQNEKILQCLQSMSQELIRRQGNVDAEPD